MVHNSVKMQPASDPWCGKKFLDEFGTLAESAEGVPKLRELILELAVRGKLVEQDPSDDSAKDLLVRIRTERKRQIANKTIRRGKELPPRNDEKLGFTIPSTWQWSQFGELGDWGAGATPRRGDTRYYGGEIVWLKSGELNDGIVTDSEENITDKALEDCSLRLNQPGDVLVAMYGATIGKLAIAGVECTTNQAVCACTCFDGVFNRFLFLLLKAFKRYFIANSSGAAQPNFSKEKIVRTSAPIPPLTEQHRIVSKVDELMGLCDRLEAVQGERRGVRVRLNRSSLDRLTSVSGVGARQRGSELSAAWQRVCDHFEVLYDTPETLPDLRQTILQLAVQGKLVPQDPNDEPAEKLLQKLNSRREELIANGDLPKSKIVPLTDHELDITAPEHWEWSRLNELVEVMNSGWSPACEPNPTNDESEWGVLKTTSVQSFVFWEHEHKRLPDNLEPRPEAEAKRGDLLMTRAGPQNRVGISCLVRKVRPRLMISDKIIRFHLIEPFMYDEFVALCLNAGVSQQHIEKSKSGMAASQMNISQSKFRVTPIPVPPHAEQKRIVSKVTHLLSQVTRLESTLTRRESTRTQLLTAAIHSILEPDA